jgi:hypothetical protein
LRVLQSSTNAVLDERRSRPTRDTHRVTTVVIPAHNEERVLPRLLSSLLGDADSNEFEVFVVSNASSDRTAEVAREWPGVTVLEIDEPSKYLALQAGDEAAGRAREPFPRLYVDADVVLTTSGARALCAALQNSATLAAAPTRHVAVDRAEWLVRAYYRVWARLPAVREGLYGRGVLAVDAEGFRRIADRPDVMGDDIYLHSQFSPQERAIVADSEVTVYGPQTRGDLLRRRIRAAQGNSQLAGVTAGATDTTRASGRELLTLARTEPRLWPSFPAFVGVTLAARYLAKRRRRSADAAVWLRDESSRS